MIDVETNISHHVNIIIYNEISCSVDGRNPAPSWMIEICRNPMSSGITSLSTGDRSLQSTLSYQIMVNVSVLTYFISYHVSFMRTQKVIISHTIRVRYLNLAIESVHCDFCICGNSSFTIIHCKHLMMFYLWGFPQIGDLYIIHFKGSKPGIIWLRNAKYQWLPEWGRCD